MLHNTPPASGIFTGAHHLDVSHSIFTETNIINTTNVSHAEHLVTLQDTPQLVLRLTNNEGEHDSRISAAKDILRIARMKAGPDHIVAAVLHANAVPQLVACLSQPGALMQHAIGVLAYVLGFPQTWNAALDRQAVPLLMQRLSDSAFDTQVYAVWALANITASERGNEEAARCGAIPALVGALGHPTPVLKRVAARAMRNIVSTDAGRRAAYAANAVQPLVALLDSRPFDEVQVDAVRALTRIACLHKAARETIKGYGAVAKLKAFSNPPGELEVLGWALRDELKRGSFFS